jgi:hypothetical protein
VAFEIEHEDRIILDAFHEKAKPLLALAQLFGRSSALDPRPLARRESAQPFIEDGEAPERGLLRQQAQPDDRVIPPVTTDRAAVGFAGEHFSVRQADSKAAGDCGRCASTHTKISGKCVVFLCKELAQFLADQGAKRMPEKLPHARICGKDRTVGLDE